MGDLADSAADWTNENIEELNSLTARISWLIDQLAPILDDAVDVMDLVEDLADELGNALDEVGAASGLGDQAEQELRAAVQSLRRAASSGKEAVARLLSALEHLGAALGSALQSQEAMEEVRAAAGDLAAALGDMSDTLAEIARILWNGGDEAALGEAAQALADTLARAGDALEQAANAVAAHMDSGELEEAGKDAAAAWQALGEAAQALRAAAGHATDAAALLAKLLAQGGDLAEAFRDPGRTLEKVASRASRLGEDLADVFWELAEEPTITIRPIDSAIREQGDALGTSLPVCWRTATPCGRPCPRPRIHYWTIWKPSETSSGLSRICCGICWSKLERNCRTVSRTSRTRRPVDRIPDVSPIPGTQGPWRETSTWPAS